MKKITLCIISLLLSISCVVLSGCAADDILAKDIEIKGNGFDKGVLTLVEGSEVTLTATVRPDDATDKSVSWKSRDITIAVVNANGLVKAISVGKTKIAVNAGEYVKEIDVNIVAYVPLTAIRFEETQMEIATGVRKQLAYTIEPINPSIKTLVFTVSPANAGVKVSSAGIVEVANDVVGGSEFTITAKGFKETAVIATIKIIVQSYVLEDIKIVSNDFHTEISTLTVPQNEPYRVLFQMPVPEKAIAPGAMIETIWTSSNTSVCKVNGKGRLTFGNKGVATITMEAMGITKQVSVTVTDASDKFVGEYYMPQNYISSIGVLKPSTSNGWQTMADFRQGGTGAPDAKFFVMQNYKPFTGPSSWFAGGGFCIEMGGWDNIHSGLEDDDLAGGGMPNLYMWSKVQLGVNATKFRMHFQYRMSDATFKYKLRMTIVDPVTKEITHLSNWQINEFNKDPNLTAGESFIECSIPEKFRGKTVIMMLEYDDIDYATDKIINGVESINVKYFSILNFDGKPVGDALWVLGDSIMTEDFTQNMLQEIATGAGYTLFRDTISGSTIAPASGIGIVDHIDANYYKNNFDEYGKPKVIVIQRGTNDVYWSNQVGNPLKMGDVTSTDKTQTYGAIRYTINHFKTLYPNARIIWSTAYWRADVDDAKMRQFNANLNTICAESQVEVLDLYTRTGFNEANSIQYLIDGIHPSKLGQTVLKDIWIEVLKK